MENKKRRGFIARQIPFILDAGYKLPTPKEKDITENGKYWTEDVDRFNVEVSEAEDLTPEAQQEILDEEY